MDKVTVIVPHYNNLQYLQDSLESITNQTHECKACIIDDASNEHVDAQEEVRQVCEIVFGPVSHSTFQEDGLYLTYKSGHKLILLNENGGPSRARNFGIAETIEHTDFFQMLDADDIMYDNKVEECLRYINVSPNIAAVYADYDLLNMNTMNKIREHKPIYSHMHLQRECIVHSGSLVRASHLDSVKDEFGYYDKTMRTCEDFDLWVRLSEKFMLLHLPMSLTEVKVHDFNSTNTVHTDVWNRNWSRINEKRQRRLTQ
jgi:glycosyltransferase involved in cell wall biosynthesis